MAETGFKLITAGRLINGLDRTPLGGGAVLVAGSSIVGVGRASDVRAPDGAEVEEHHYPGGTILPGLVDAHTHFNYLGDGTHTDVVMELPDDTLLMRSIVAARTHLEAGVTTIRECGAKNRTAFSLKEGRHLGLVKGPRMLVCGRPITITGGHMWQMGGEADGADGMRRAVRQLIKEGADWIKVPATGGSTSTSFPTRPACTVEELRAIVSEAHNFARLVGTHCVSTGGIVNSLDAGVDMIIHATMRQSDGSWDFRPDIAERMADDGRLVNPTLHIMRARLWAMQDMADAGIDAHLTEGSQRWDLETIRYETDMRFENTQRLLEAGVRMIAGSDSGFGWYPFGQFWRELEAFTEIGMTPMEAIAAGTRDAAEAIGVSHLTGTLAAGKEADLLVVNGDPADDIRALADVEAVFLGGVRVT